MARHRLRVIFAGKATDEGAIDIADLAPALIALGELFEAAHHCLNGRQGEPRVRISAASKSRSFEVDLFLQEDILDVLRTTMGFSLLLTPQEVMQSVAGLIAMLKAGWRLGVMTKEGLLGLLSGGEKDGLTRYEINIFSKNKTEIMNVYGDQVVRGSLEKTFNVLDRDDFDSVTLLPAGEEPLRVEKADLPALQAGAIENQEMTPSWVDIELEVRKAAFEPDLAWDFKQGSTNYPAHIEDKNFLERVATRAVGARRGDIYKVRMRVESRITKERKLRMTYFIEKVLRILPYSRGALPFNNLKGAEGAEE